MLRRHWVTMPVCVCSHLQVQLFRWIEKDDGVQELQTECGYHGHTVALNMQVNLSCTLLSLSAVTKFLALKFREAQRASCCSLLAAYEK